jgi:hypothetical protein
LDLSVIVNFYNMRREAARTLTALTRAYQLGAEDLEYEVLCLDNGSNPPLEADFVESFGKEFRLIRAAPAHPSPVGPMNAAASEAKGRFLAIMIDGAHIVTPGAFKAAMEAFREDPESIVALRQWFMGGDQRWLAAAGYTREMEDEIFDGLGWPEDGYSLFRAGVPMDGRMSSHWFRGMAESNCLFLPARLWREIGGYDEGFDEPGAGLANLDLFSKAIQASKGPLIGLLGEASFHQFHGGTTTNVSDEQKDRLVRDFMIKYQEVKGEAFRSADMSSLTFRGRFRAASALKLDKRPAFPRPIPLTDAVRPLPFEETFDFETRQYLISAYTEANADRPTYWLGEPISLYPADLISLQEVMARTRPTRVVLVNTEPGLVRFVDSVLGLLDVPDPMLIRVLETDAPPLQLRARLKTLVGKPYAKAIKARLLDLVGTSETTMVLFGIHDPTDFRVGQLAAYAKLVSHRCYMVVLGTAQGHPWIGYSRLRARDAIRELVQIDRGLVIDTSWDRNVLSSCPSGFVVRIGDPYATYDESLDDLSQLTS